MTRYVRDDVRHGVGAAEHDAHLWVPGVDYFGPVWADGVGWAVPQGWEPPHGWTPPPGWYQPTYWHHEDYRGWCDNHYSGDHDWRCTRVHGNARPHRFSTCCHGQRRWSGPRAG